MKYFTLNFAKYNNSIPMIDFFDRLSITKRALIYKNKDFNLSNKFTKPLRDCIFELKIDLKNKTSVSQSKAIV